MENKTLLLQLMQISEQQYDEMVFEYAYRYLVLQIGYDEFSISLLTGTTLFWKWWTNQWNRRNRILIHEYKLDQYPGTDIREFVRREFYRTHCPESLNVYPSKPIMDEAYAIMMGELMDQLRKEAYKD